MSPARVTGRPAVAAAEAEAEVVDSEAAEVVDSSKNFHRFFFKSRNYFGWCGGKADQPVLVVSDRRNLRRTERSEKQDEGR